MKCDAYARKPHTFGSNAESPILCGEEPKSRLPAETADFWHSGNDRGKAVSWPPGGYGWTGSKASAVTSAASSTKLLP
ncbi:MAG: hypothetical protein QOJ50_2034 [Cryptosporangiaceae bacterium]|jgi:hypothetical protein|nr:hypothetical protein [Cryptosporangiaceae bacterium]